MEYTPLNSYAYRQQVIQELDGTISADRPFSFRHQFARLKPFCLSSRIPAVPRTGLSRG
jgi:hypothetical protein